MNRLYGWKGRVHKAIKVFEQCKMEYVRVCALPRTKNAMMKTINKTTSNHDADIALTWVLLESSRKVVDATVDGYIASIRRSFDDYRRIQAENAIAQQATLGTAAREQLVANNNDPTDPNITIWIEGVVENTINSHVQFIEQWRAIISDAQKEASGWKSKHEKYLNKICEIEKAQKQAADPDYNSDDDSVDSYDSDPDSDSDDEDDLEKDADDDENDDESEDGDDDETSIDEHKDQRLELLRKGMRVDEQADKLFQLGTYVSAGKVLISSLKIASKIESIETAAQEAGTASILGLTQANLRDRDVVLPSLNHPITVGSSATQSSTVGCNKSEKDIVNEWKEETDTTKVNAIYFWYRLYHGALTCVNTEEI